MPSEVILIIIMMMAGGFNLLLSSTNTWFVNFAYYQPGKLTVDTIYPKKILLLGFVEKDSNPHTFVCKSMFMPSNGDQEITISTQFHIHKIGILEGQVTNWLDELCKFIQPNDTVFMKG